MPKTYKELHQEKHKLETLETLASTYQTLGLIRICAENATDFQEFKMLLEKAMSAIETKMNE